MSPALELVEDGDLVALKSKHGGLPALTRFFTRSPYTHTAVAIRLDGKPWVAEMNAGGNHLVPLSRYDDVEFDVFPFPGDRGVIRNSILESLHGKIPYDVLDLLRIAAFNVLHLQLPRTDRGGMVCSAYSSWIWRSAGWAPPETIPSIPSPADLVAALPLVSLNERATVVPASA